MILLSLSLSLSLSYSKTHADALRNLVVTAVFRVALRARVVLGLRSGFDPPDLDRPGSLRLPHQQVLGLKFRSG